MPDDPAPIYPAMLGDFIQTLQGLLAAHGDMPVMARGLGGPYGWRTSKVGAHREECYWDGGGPHPAEDTPYAPRHWVRSRYRREHPYHILIDACNPETALAEDPPDTRDTIDGVPVDAIAEGD